MIGQPSPRKLMFALAEHVEMFPHRRPGVGQYVMSLPADVRERFAGLKSSDIADVRWPLWDLKS